MNICLISQEYPPETGGGGIGTQTWLKAQGLSKRGHSVHVVSVSWDSQARAYLDGAAMIHRIPEPRLNVPGYEQSTYWLAYSMMVAGKLTELSREIAFDIYQFPEYCGEGFIWQTDTFAQRSGKYVVQLHGPLKMFTRHMGWPEEGSTTEQIGSFMERTVIHHSDLVLASSHSTAALCQREYGYPAERVRVIHSGIDTQRFSPRDVPGEGRFPRILFVGNLVGAKGFNLLVDATCRLRERYPNIVLRTIGKGAAEDVEGARKRAEAAGATANIEFMGYVSHADLPEHFGWCDMFAGPSMYEGGPGNVYLEAMACGKPVIACNNGGVPEVVLHEKTGLLIPPRDGTALENAIARLADDTALRSQLGENGRQWAEQFSIDRYIDKIERHYSELLDGN